MPSYDLKISIERYPAEQTCGWGCPDLNLMGYSSLEELFKDIQDKLNLMMGKQIPKADKKEK